MRDRDSSFASEAEMVAVWIEQLQDNRHFRNSENWTVYPETAGWDLLLVHRDGYQVGIEAKLSLNAKVLAQALSDSTSYWRIEGPDYRAVMVPTSKCQHHMKELASALGLRIITVERQDSRTGWSPVDLPNEGNSWSTKWSSWLPGERCKLPDYIPDVSAGHKSPVQLTDWKIRAIKLMIVLHRRGFVTRRDMKAIQISPTRWCDHYCGLLTPSETKGGYIAGKRTPDLRAQHPVNYAQIEADWPTWGPPLFPDL